MVEQFKVMRSFGAVLRAVNFGEFAEHWQTFMVQLEKLKPDLEAHLTLTWQHKHDGNAMSALLRLAGLIADNPDGSLYLIRITGTINEIAEMYNAPWIREIPR